MSRQASFTDENVEKFRRLFKSLDSEAWQWRCEVAPKETTQYYNIPVVPRKAVAEVSPIGNL